MAGRHSYHLRATVDEETVRPADLRHHLRIARHRRPLDRSGNARPAQGPVVGASGRGTAQPGRLDPRSLPSWRRRHHRAAASSGIAFDVDDGIRSPRPERRPPRGLPRRPRPHRHRHDPARNGHRPSHQRRGCRSLRLDRQQLPPRVRRRHPGRRTLSDLAGTHPRLPGIARPVRRRLRRLRLRQRSAGHGHRARHPGRRRRRAACR